MDNSLKLLLGVLTVSGLLAMLVPSESPVAPPVASVPAPAPPPPIVQPTVDEETVDPEDQAEMTDDEYFDAGNFRMGEPSIDGLPFGGEIAPPALEENQVSAEPPSPPMPVPPPVEPTVDVVQ